MQDTEIVHFRPILDEEALVLGLFPVRAGQEEKCLACGLRMCEAIDEITGETKKVDQADEDAISAYVKEGKAKRGGKPFPKVVGAYPIYFPNDVFAAVMYVHKGREQLDTKLAKAVSKVLGSTRCLPSVAKAKANAKVLGDLLDDFEEVG